MSALKDWSIRHKLTFVTMITSSAALLVTCAAFVTYDYVTMRRLMVTGLAAHADVVGANCTAALAFADADEAARTLGSFAAEPQILASRVCDADGLELAFYVRPGYARPELPPAVAPGTHAFRADRLTVARAIRLDGNVVGTIYVCSDLGALRARGQSYLFVFGGVIAVASATAWLLASRLQRLIASPILHLAETARRVSADRDYATRAVKHGRDELGTLIDCFNEMLDQIQQRDVQLEAHRTHLEQQVTMRTEDLRGTNDELRAARDRAEAANRAKSAFLANMSHEIRTPMTAIVGYADMMLEPDQTTSDRQDCLQVIRRNARHLLALIGDILDLSKIEADKMTVERIACDPAQLAADVVSLIRPKALEKGLTFRLDFGDEVPRQVMSDPLRLKQILVNLSGNAVKFTERGGVRMRVSCERGADGGLDRLRYDITDTGIGLSPGQSARLFQPFSQADESMTRRFGGTGLGLVISKRLAELLGGDIAVHSLPGVGSTFTVVVDPGPLDGVEMARGLEESMIAAAPEQTARPAVRLAGRILLAEDGPDNQRLISTHLRRAGAEVVVVENGRLALERLASDDPFDLIFMDMQMPELDGYGAASELRRRGWIGPIIALTAHAMSGDREKCLRAGCTGYLTKPVDRDVLVGTAATHLPGSAPVETAADAGTAQSRLSSAAAPAEGNAGEILRSEYATEPDMCEVLETYVAGLPRQVARLNELYEAGGLDELRRALHQIKGAGGGYGFPGVTRLAARAEEALKVEAHTDALRREIDVLISLIRRVEGYDMGRERICDAEAVAH